jgi:nitrite reductase/ring-hydroxylating ferredoxin subunit
MYWLASDCFDTIHIMQSFDTKGEVSPKPQDRSQTVAVGRVEDLRPGQCTTVELNGVGELTIYNVNGEFYATESLCPHQGAPLGSGTLCGHVVECFLHGWQFDVRTGECLTVSERLKTFPVSVADGLIRITDI